MALYMVGFISYGATLVFYAAVFPRLARNTPHARQLKEKYENGDVSAEEYEQEESLEKNRISNISTVRYFIRLSPLHRIRRRGRFETLGNNRFSGFVGRYVDAQQYWLHLHSGA